MPEARVTLYLRLKPDLAAEIEADRIAFGIATTTAAAEAILKAGLDARALDRQEIAAIRRTIETVSVIFIAESGEGAGGRLRKGEG